MAQKDYLLRLIEMAGEMLIRLRKKLLGQEIDAAAAEEELQQAAGRAGLDLDFLRSVSRDTLIMLISPTGEPEPGRCWITAELFLVDGLRAEAEGDPSGALERYERARLLYELLGPGIIARGFPEVGERIQDVECRIAELADLEAGT